MAALQPHFRFTFHLAKYPATGGTVVYRWGTRPLADAGAWTEGRLLSIGPIERACSDQNGNYELARLRVEIEDSDALIRGLLSAVSTKFFTAREAELELLSEAGRAAGLTWRKVFRGRVTDVQMLSPRKAEIEVTDLVGSHFSGFDLDKTIPIITLQRSEHANLPDGNVGLPYHLLVGEISDYGTVDANGNPADKGMVPVVDCGDYSLSNNPVNYLTVPDAPTSVVVGAAGTAVYYYDVTAYSSYGQSLASSVTIVTAAPTTAQMSATRYVSLSGTLPTGAVSIRIYGRTANPPSTWLGDAVISGTSWYYQDGAVSVASPASPTVGNVDSEKAPGPPKTSTAITNTDVYGRLMVSLGAIQDILDVYWSDLAEGTAPKRERAAASDYGNDLLAPGHTGWPYATSYQEINGIRATYIYVRGDRLLAHRDGSVTIAANVCGMEETGDATGDIVDDAFPALQLFLNEHVLKHAGTGYKGGENWGPLETYSNGDAQLKTTAFAACQAVTVNRIGGTGYKAAWAITGPMTVDEFVQRFCLTFDCRLTSNHWGQVLPVLIDDLAVATTGRIYRDKIDIDKLESQRLEHDETENRIVFNYDRDADANVFRIRGQVIEDAVSIAAHVPGGVVGSSDKRGVRQGEDQDLWCTRDATTAADSRGRRINRNKAAPRYVAFSTDLEGQEDEIGAQIRETHYDGYPDIANPLVVLRSRLDPTPFRTTLTGFDLGAILAANAPVLGDDTALASTDFFLGDDTSAAAPTTGPYALVVP